MTTRPDPPYRTITDQSLPTHVSPSTTAARQKRVKRSASSGAHTDTELEGPAPRVTPVATTVLANPTLGAPRQKPTQPLRTTKTSQKLVIFPEDDRVIPPPVEEPTIFDQAPTYVDTQRTEAERMPKDMRADANIPRATAYYTAGSCDLQALAAYLKNIHGVRPRKYDECLYAPYHFPLLPGTADARLKSSPPLRSPGGNVIHDKQLETIENINLMTDGNRMSSSPSSADKTAEPHLIDDFESKRRSTEVVPFAGGECFFFDYGVTVFWNFSEREEMLILADIARFQNNRLSQDVREEFHFQYQPDALDQKPRIYNDMITIKSGNHLLKLTISHAIAQSTVLAYYEDEMDSTIDATKSIPQRLALSGHLDMSRTQVTKLNGQLFKLRMHVNLVSNVLDTPEIFWSEPSLQPLYNVIKLYLEIPQRAKILNDRCAVLSDLLEVLREHMNSAHMHYQTWIIIWLIVIAVLVACGEIFVKALNQAAGLE
ncbi:uncharacterized protein VTP21DRAFT_3952 [Calcarisporiella thermophila]|uniref:uncharacterized protein n=1 Tax=Calcarisporiella thermophila TaxID=911321 RepID=UPI0037445145